MIDDVNLAAILAFLLRARRPMARGAAACAIVVLLVGLLSHRTFTVTTTFYPQSSDQNGSGLLGLAAQVGLNVSGQDQTQSPDFYVTLIGSGRILRRVIDTVYDYHLDDSLIRSDLVQYYQIDEHDRDVAVKRAMDRLNGHVNASTDPKTGVVQLTVETKSPDLSAAVSGRILGLLNEYDAQTRQTQAGQERHFLEGRMADVKGLLRQAEDRMQTFLEKNRDFRNSPQLVFEQTRLQQDIDLEQGVFNTLAQSYEQARIDEVRNLPVLTVVEVPRPPAVPDRRRLALKGVVAILVGTLLGLVFAVFRGYLDGTRGGQGPAVDLRALWQDAWPDIRRPWRLIWPFRKEA